MRLRFVVFATMGLLLLGAPALAQGAGAGGNFNNDASAGGGSASSGDSSSSASIQTSGDTSVGVAQGNVVEGGSAFGSSGSGSGQSGGSSSGGSGSGSGGQTAGVVNAPASPVSVEEGVVTHAELPALQLGETQAASDRGPDAATWAIAGLIVVGLVVLYRRIPRTRPA